MLKGTITIEANMLDAGTYIYELSINGIIKDSKQLILTK
jgi:hypothetical protein